MSGPEATDRPSTGRNRVRSAFEPLLGIEGARLDAGFTLVLLVFVATLLVQTLDYGRQTRLVPLVIGVPTLVMLAALLAIQLSPRLAGIAGRHAAGSVFDDLTDGLEDFDRDEPREAHRDDRSIADGRFEFVVVLGWVGALFGLVVVVGFIAGSFVYLVAFYRLQAGQDWLRTTAYAVVVWVFAVVVFKAVLNTPLYEGLLGIEVPLPV